MGVKQEDFVNGWKRMQSLQAGFQVFLGSIAAKVFQGEGFNKMAEGLNKVLSGNAGDELATSIRSIVTGFIELLPMAMEFAKVMAGVTKFVVENKWLFQLIAGFTLFAFIAQPILTLFAVLLESIAATILLMGYLGPSMSLGGRAFAQLGAGAFTASNGILATNGALATMGAMIAPLIALTVGLAGAYVLLSTVVGEVNNGLFIMGALLGGIAGFMVAGPMGAVVGATVGAGVASAAGSATGIKFSDGGIVPQYLDDGGIAGAYGEVILPTDTSSNVNGMQVPYEPPTRMMQLKGGIRMAAGIMGVPVAVGTAVEALHGDWMMGREGKSPEEVVNYEDPNPVTSVLNPGFGLGYKAVGYAAMLGRMFRPKGTDTIPAMLTPGEFVVNATAAKKFGYANLSYINTTYKQDGGVVLPSGVPESVVSAANFSASNKMGDLTDATYKGADASKTAAKVLSSASGGSWLNVKILGDKEWTGKGDETSGSFDAGSLLKSAAGILAAAGSALLNALPTALGAGPAAGGVGKAIDEKFKWPDLSGLWEALKERLRSAWEFLGRVFSGAWEGLKEALSGAWEGLKKAFGKIWEKLGLPDISTIWDGFKLALKNLWKDLELPDMTDITTKLSQIKNDFLNGLEKSWKDYLGIQEEPKLGPEKPPEIPKQKGPGIAESFRRFMAAMHDVLNPDEKEMFERYNDPKKGRTKIKGPQPELQYGDEKGVEVFERPSSYPTPEQARSIRYTLNQPFSYDPTQANKPPRRGIQVPQSVIDAAKNQDASRWNLPEMGEEGKGGFLSGIIDWFRKVTTRVPKNTGAVPGTGFSLANMPSLDEMPDFSEEPPKGQTVAESVTAPEVTRSNWGYGEDAGVPVPEAQPPAPEGYQYPEGTDPMAAAQEAVKKGIVDRVKGFFTPGTIGAGIFGGILGGANKAVTEEGKWNQEAIDNPLSFAPDVAMGAAGGILFTKAAPVAEAAGAKAGGPIAQLFSKLLAPGVDPNLAKQLGAEKGAQYGSRAFAFAGGYLGNEFFAEGGQKYGKLINTYLGGSENNAQAGQVGAYTGQIANIALSGGGNPVQTAFAALGSFASDMQGVMGEAAKTAQRAGQDAAGGWGIDTVGPRLFGDPVTELMNMGLDVGRIVSGKVENTGNEGTDRAAMASDFAKMMVDVRTSLLGSYGGVENGQMVRKGGIVEDITKGMHGQSGDGSSGAIGDSLQAINGAGQSVCAALDAAAASIMSAATTAGNALLGVGTTILGAITSGLSTLNGIGASIREIILGMIKGIPIVGETAATVIGAVTDPIGTVKKIVGAADGGLMTKDGIINAHAGEIIGPLSSVSDILTKEVRTTGTTSGNSGSTTFHVSVPITINGNADKQTVVDIKRELEVLLPRLLKTYDMGSLGI